MAEPPQESLVINVWMVPDGNQNDLIAGLRGMYEHLRGHEGFVEGQIFESVDRTHVLSYARFRSAADRQKAMTDPALGAAQRAMEAVARGHVHTYEPVALFRPPSRT